MPCASSLWVCDCALSTAKAGSSRLHVIAVAAQLQWAGLRPSCYDLRCISSTVQCIGQAA